MDSAKFEVLCKQIVMDYANKHLDKSDNAEITENDVYVVWSCKTLQNYKCLASTTVSNDGIYAEYTYNGDKQELYEDVYKKLSNGRIIEE